jgi:hypothetical protein
MIGIYKITSPTGKIYIGQSVEVEKRLTYYKAHFTVHGSSQRRLYSSIKKYGVEQHIYEIVEECKVEELNERERYWQDFYDVLSENGLNCKLTGTEEKSGRVNKETSNAMSKARKGKPIGPFSQKTREIMVKAREEASYTKNGALLQICSKTGEVLASYRSAKQAEKEKKFSSVMISQSVKTGTKHKGFYFVYEVGKDAIRYLPIGKTNSELERERAFRKNGKLIAISPETGRIVETFRSIADAVDKGFTRTGIVKSKRDGSKHKGYVWKYEKK